MTDRRRIWAIAGGLFALALAIRLYGLGWGLPAVYEEAQPFKRSWDMWGWGQRDKLDFNPHFFNYPTFYFYVQFAGQGLLYLVLKLRGAVASALDYRILYALDKTPFYLMGRGISALFGAATVPVTFAIGRRIGGLWVAIPAALLVAVNQTHISKSQVIEVDVPMTLLAALCCLFSLRILEGARRRDYLLAGLCGGLTTSTKYNGALLALPILIAHLLATRRGAASPGTTPGKRPRGTAAASRPWKDLALAALVFAVTVLATSPYLLLDHQNFWTGFNYERLHMRLGHFGLNDTPALLWYLQVMIGSLFGWPLTLLAGAGLLVYAAGRRRDWALVLAVFPVVYVTLISSWSMKADRYILPLLPIAALFAAALVAEVAARLGRYRAWLPASATALAVLAMAAPSIAAYRRDLARLKSDTRTLACEWIEASVPPGSFILAEAYGPAPFGIIDLLNLEPEVRERIRERQPALKTYALNLLPMYQVMPQNSALFYDMRLYRDVADLVVVSSSVASRYRKEPAKFRAQNAFYDSLEAGWNKLREFGPADGSGPRITLYGNRRQTTPFARRKDVPPPPPPPVVPDLLPGAFGGFFGRLAFNYEGYGFAASAAQIYQMGLRYRDQPADERRNLAFGAVRSSIAAGLGDQALAILLQMERQAAGPSEAAFWRDLRQKLTAPAGRDTTRNAAP